MPCGVEILRTFKKCFLFSWIVLSQYGTTCLRGIPSSSPNALHFSLTLLLVTFSFSYACYAKITGPVFSPPFVIVRVWVNNWRPVLHTHVYEEGQALNGFDFIFEATETQSYPLSMSLLESVHRSIDLGSSISLRTTEHLLCMGFKPRPEILFAKLSLSSVVLTSTLQISLERKISSRLFKVW